MARARNIKPGTFKNEVLGVADPIYTLLFEGLWLLADREGRLEDRPLRIKGEIFPYRDGLDINELLNWLQANGFILRYVADGVKCIVVLEFVKHQNPHKNEPESILPAPGEIEATPEPIETTPEKIGSAPADSLIPDSGFLIPDAGSLNLAPQPPAAPRPRKPAAEAKEPAPSTAVWVAYSDAYETRYGSEPVRNAKVNGQLAQLVGRLGAQESPHIAAFYVGHNAQFYVRDMHSVGLLLRDAEKLRTEWATNRQMTTTKAQQADKTATNYGAFQGLIEEAEARERNHAQ
jgi:hypothetical protein